MIPLLLALAAVTAAPDAGDPRETNPRPNPRTPDPGD